MAWIVDPGVFSDALQMTYLLMATFIVIYFAEFLVTALEFGFSKKFTAITVIGLSILIIGWWLLTAIGIPFCTTYPGKGVAVEKVVVEYSFAIFYVIILFGVVLSLVVVALFLKRYFEERKVLGKVEEYKREVEGMEGDVGLIKEKVAADDDRIKSMHEEYNIHKGEYKEIKER